MLDDFFTRAIIAGIGIAAVVGPLGCFIVWRRLAYMGDAMAHSALLGVALALALDINIMIGVFALCLLIALILARVGERSSLSGDSMLGILSHSTLALGLVIVSLMYWIRVDILHYLFGNILSVSWSEIIMIYVGGALVVAILCWKWKAFVGLSVNEQIAEAENLNPVATRYLQMIMLAAIIASAMKIVGLILVVALLIIPASASRLISKSPEQMAVFASIIGVLSVIGGLYFSLELDTPPGPSIVLNAMIIFLLMICGLRLVIRDNNSGINFSK